MVRQEGDGRMKFKVDEIVQSPRFKNEFGVQGSGFKVQSWTSDERRIKSTISRKRAQETQKQVESQPRMNATEHKSVEFTTESAKNTEEAFTTKAPRHQEKQVAKTPAVQGVCSFFSRGFVRQDLRPPPRPLEL